MAGIPLRADPAGVMRAERTSWQRAIAAHVLSTNHRSDPSKIVRSHWEDDQRALLITRGAVTQTTSTGGYPTYDPLVAFRSLAPSSAALALFQMGLALNLEGASTIRIPCVAGLPVQPVFVGEGMPAPNVQGNFPVTVLGPVRKILLLSCVTAELENGSADTAAAVIGRVLADTATIGIDNAAFGTQAADAVTPAGLLHNVAATTAATAGADAMQKDLGALTEAIGETGIDPNGAVFVCGPREATIIRATVGARFDNPVLTTLGLPAKSVACFAPAGVASGYQDAPSIDTSKAAVQHMEEDAPLQLSQAGTPAVVAYPMKSIYQLDLISIRVRANAAWAVSPGAAQIINSVTW